MIFFRRFLIGSSLTLTGFLAGSYVERKRREPCSQQTLPGLFDAVYAATPTSLPDVVPAKGISTNRVSQIMKYGFPGFDQIRSFDDFVLSYDRRNRVAHWVFEHLTQETVKHNPDVDRAKCDFKPDDTVHPFFRSENSDYKHSGFDRGHLAAAGNHKANQKHCEDTFFLSNMAPQVGSGFNRDAWNKLEKYVRKLTKKFVNVYCCTGPLYLPRKEADGKTYVKYQVIGTNNVAVPTHFFKVVVCERSDGKMEMEAFVMPNQVINNETPLTMFQVPPETIERAAGLLFFSQVNRKHLVSINGKSP
uniref:Endonuclease n=1 Tax=Lutzomyia longipalpis TaxID=7200 RepID=A0A1B0CHB6_LUTLO